MENLTFEAVYTQLSERGRLEWEMAVLRAENVLLRAELTSESDAGTQAAE